MNADRESRRSLWIWPLVGLVLLYRYLISPLLHFIAPGSGCRYHPTCSAYALGAWRQHGVIRGTWLTVRRLSDCQPWGGSGEDPVPAQWPGWWYSRRSLRDPGGEEPVRSSLPPSH